MKNNKAKVVLLRARNQKYQVKQGDVFINDSRNRDWGSLEALVCERVTRDGHAWNGHGIQTDINHLYLISDEEIKDKKIYNKHCLFFGWQGGKDYNDKSPCLAGKDIGSIRTLGKYYEILATTDKSLNLPQIPQSFIKQYIEADGKIDEVDIEITCLYGDNCPSKGAYDKQHLCKIGIKVDSNNCVIIHTVKDSWSREEVEKLLLLAFNANRYSIARV